MKTMNNDTEANRTCPGCRQPLPADAPEGLCPECLMMGGLEETVPDTASVSEGERPAGHLPGIGEEFGGYRIDRELGRGGMGAVYEAEQLETGRRVALKLLNHQLDSPEARARFLREGRLAASINHPNSVYVFGTEEIEGMPAIAMELVAGGTLEQRVKVGGPLPVGEAVDAILQVIAGLEAAQAIGILHRDIKPANCYEDADGTVKIGDFGLSISTEARGETHLTLEGAVFGTPAFASPEQLRGEELNARSDIYSVGVTLYYLLTGRTPFQGKSVAQLFANVLEGNAPSPKGFREELPGGLVRAVMRCLERTPGERFRDYAELRQALAPFGSEAPVPAPVPLRGLAGVIDMILVSGLAMIAHVFFFVDATTFNQPASDSQTAYIALMVGSLFAWVLYYAILEGHWGASLGKAVCGLRVAGPHRNPPGFVKALTRALIVLILPALPVWTYFDFDPTRILAAGSQLLTQLISYSFYVILGLLFVTVRRRNGFAAVHDLLTKTRVVRKAALHERIAPSPIAAAPVDASESAARIGPYHVLETLEKTEGGAEWHLAYDLRLLRKTWVRVVPPGTPPVPPSMRKMGRVGRLRWIAGRRLEGENWDAFEAPGGQSLASLVGKERPSWKRVCFWLLDLAREIDSAQKDDTIPARLSFDHVWITADGRAKLLDFAAPGAQDKASDTMVDDAVELLKRVAATAADPLPLHAREFVGKLTALPSGAAAMVVMELKPLIGRFVTVSRARRAALVAGCVAFPLLAIVGFALSMRMLENWHRRQPDVLATQQVLALRQMGRYPWMKNEKSIDDRLFSIYIASHFRELITSEAEWTSFYALSMIAGEKRRFAERSVADHPDPGEEEIREADAAVGPHAKAISLEVLRNPWLPLVVGVSTLSIYVAVPAVIGALLFRGGLVLLVCGVAVARRDGVRASRGRAFWRSLVAWSPLILSPFPLGFLTGIIGVVWASIVAGAVVLILVVVSLALPDRGLQDRIAGTCLVPR